VHEGQDHAGDDEERERDPDPAVQGQDGLLYPPQHGGAPLVPVDAGLEPLEDRRAHLDAQDHQVEGDAHAHFEQDRITLPVEDGPPDVPVAPEVEAQGDGHPEVAQERGQDGRPEQRQVFLPAEDVHQGGGGEAAGGQRHAASDVEGDPDAPGVVVVQVGHGAEPEDQAGDAEGVADPHDDQQGDGTEREERLGDPMGMVVERHRSPPSAPGAEPSGGCSLRWLNHMMPESRP